MSKRWFSKFCTVNMVGPNKFLIKVYTEIYCSGWRWDYNVN